MSAQLDPPAVTARIDRGMVHHDAHRSDCDCHGCAVRRTWRHGPKLAVIDTSALDRVTDGGWRNGSHAAAQLQRAAANEPAAVQARMNAHATRDAFAGIPADDAAHYAGTPLATRAEQRYVPRSLDSYREEFRANLAAKARAEASALSLQNVTGVI